MHAAYLTFTCITAIACAYAAYMSITRAEMITDTAQRLHIPVSLMRPFGILLGSPGSGYWLALRCRDLAQPPRQGWSRTSSSL